MESKRVPSYIYISSFSVSDMLVFCHARINGVGILLCAISYLLIICQILLLNANIGLCLISKYSLNYNIKSPLT